MPLAALFLAGVATRAPFVGTYLANWDSVQYALGLTEFDVVRHQPHPPGSILYVALGRLALAITGEANLALAWISVLAGAASIVLCYVVGRELFGARIALAGTVLFFASPLTWYYGAVALPYALEGALALAAVGLCWRAAEDRRLTAVVLAAAVLAVAGGVRQTTMLLLLPLWLYASWRADLTPWPPSLKGKGERWGVGLAESGPAPTPLGWRPANAHDESPRPPSSAGKGPGVRSLLVGGAVMAVLCLAWAVPLLVLSGGPALYVTASRQLTSLVSSLTSVFVIGLPAIAANVSYVWDVATVGLNLALATFAVYLLPGVRWPWRPSPAQRWFLWLWIGPPLLVFALMHIGQAGYLLLIWPLVCYAAATASLTAADELARRFRARKQLSPTRQERRLSAASVVIGALALSSMAIFLYSPLLGGVSGLAASRIRETDRFWRGVADIAQGLPPNQTVILTGTGARESFRHATYYLPPFHVFAVGLDRDGALGVAFQGYEGEHTYAQFMAGDAASRYHPLPAGTQRLLILDQSVAHLFPAGALQTVEVTPHRDVWLWPAIPLGEELHSLSFREPLIVE
ncbi:MAG: glycosyltransferase family 39 protein [Chloroflexota bacterium]